jgi:hypothetical protein
LALLLALWLGAATATARPTYEWKNHRFRTVPLVTVERQGRFLLGVFPRTTDGLGETLRQSDWWLGPVTGNARVVEHGFRLKDQPFTDVMFFRETEPLPTLQGTLRIAGDEVTLLDLDGDAVPEVLYPMSIDAVLKKSTFSLRDWPTVDVVLAWDAAEGRLRPANADHRVFLGTRLGPAYDALRRDLPEERLPGVIQLAFYFFGTGQIEEGRALLAKHLTDAHEREAVEKAFTAIVSVPWSPPCGCDKGRECHPQARLCQPRGVDRTWHEWPKRVTLTPSSLVLAPGSGRRNFWDDDGTDPDPYLELSVDNGAPLRSPVATDTLSTSWMWKAEFDLYPLTALKIVVKDRDGAIDQIIAMKSLSAKELLEKALASAGEVELKLRNVRRLLLKVEDLPPPLPAP